MIGSEETSLSHFAQMEKHDTFLKRLLCFTVCPKRTQKRFLSKRDRVAMRQKAVG
jgi:hypothetical protein